MKFCKSLFVLILAASLAACSTNPATGKQQFAGLMSPQQEVSVGASEHEKISAEFGFYNDPALQAYVTEIGRRVTIQTERPDVAYKFFILDSPIVNAFALPGGYVYVSRGLLALANSEAELAAVLSHETGHITGRHAAERYSQGVLTTLGAAVISAAVDNTGVSRALGVGSDLYLSSYSRGQEAEADSLGLRYMSRGGYNTAAMSSFLESLQRDSALESREKGKSVSGGFSYFSTHPATAERVTATQTESMNYPQGGTDGRDKYMTAISGMTYGDSERQGIVRGQDFYHPVMGFAFTAPSGFKITNQPDKVVATSPSGVLILFDIVGNPSNSSPADYIARGWMKGDNIPPPEQITVNGMPGATSGFDGSVDGKPAAIRLVAISWKGQFARFQIAMPRNPGAQTIEDLRRTTYSFRNLTNEEKAGLKPSHVQIITAKPGDTVLALTAAQPFSSLNEEKFRVLNGLTAGEAVKPGTQYKRVVE